MSEEGFFVFLQTVMKNHSDFSIDAALGYYFIDHRSLAAMNNASKSGYEKLRFQRRFLQAANGILPDISEEN